MSRVTKKYQVSIPRVLAEQYGIAPGDDLIWEALRVRRAEPRPRSALSQEELLRLFDAATKRQQARNRAAGAAAPTKRGWMREELYDRDTRAR